LSLSNEGFEQLLNKKLYESYFIEIQKNLNQWD